MDAIDRRGSFAAAADELGRVPSALSYTMQKLEEELDVVLFDRSGHRTKFTNVGRMLLERGRVLLEAADKLTTDAEALARGWETHLTLVTEALVPTEALFPLVNRLADKANTQLSIITEVLANVTRDEAIEKLMTTDIPFDLCQHFADLQDDQQAWDAGFFQGIDYPSGKHIGIVKAPAIFSSGEAEFGPSGYPGEYTREVLKEYGFDDAKIDELREQGLVTEEDQWDKDQYNMEKLMAQAAAAKKKAE